jgi:hypothetical protein
MGFPAVIARLAYVYVWVLFVLEILLFAASLLLHLSVLIMGSNKVYAEYGAMFFRGSVIIGIPTTAFVKDSLRWKDQIQSCPKWIWKGCLALGMYALLLVCLLMIFPAGRPLSDLRLMISVSPVAMDAISLSILWSVLRSGYLERSEVIRRAMHSVGIVTLGVVVFLAYRAGYFHHPKNN